MPRPRICRRVRFGPRRACFLPEGVGGDMLTTYLTVDEFEAIRLKDVEGLDQEGAAGKMGVSQPTFCRTLASARRKVANALVNGNAIRIEGGSYRMMRGGAGGGMPGRGRRRGGGNPPTACMCPSCGQVQPKIRGQPCSTTRCGKCGKFMMRGDRR